jgi:hypothetical protein
MQEAMAGATVARASTAEATAEAKAKAEATTMAGRGGGGCDCVLTTGKADVRWYKVQEAKIKQKCMI